MEEQKTKKKSRKKGLQLHQKQLETAAIVQNYFDFEENKSNYTSYQNGDKILKTVIFQMDLTMPPYPLDIPISGNLNFPFFALFNIFQRKRNKLICSLYTESKFVVFCI